MQHHHATIDMQTVDKPWRVEIGEHDTCTIHVVCPGMTSELSLGLSNIPDPHDPGVPFDEAITIDDEGLLQLSDPQFHGARYLVFNRSSAPSGAEIARIFVTFKKLNPISVAGP